MPAVATIDRADWHERRRQGIGGSDAPAVVGRSPFKTALDVYREKRGEAPPDDEETEAMYWGTEIEPLLLRRFSKETGFAVDPDQSPCRHPEHDWLFCHPDGRVHDQRATVQAKTVLMNRDGEWGEPWTDEVPEHVLIQCQHELAATGYVLAYVPMLILASRTFRVYTVPRDDELIDMLVERETEFWEMVQTGTPPEIDVNHPRALELIRKAHPGTNGEVIALPPSAANWHQVMEEAAEIESRYKKLKEGAKAHLLSLMGDAAIGMLPGGGAYVRKERKRKETTQKACSWIELSYTDKET